jgi:hypothetical protein
MVAEAQSVRALDCGSETTGGGQRRSSPLQRLMKRQHLPTTADDAYVGTAYDTVVLDSRRPVAVPIASSAHEFGPMNSESIQTFTSTNSADAPRSNLGALI